MEHDQLLLDAIECARLAGKIQLQHFRTANLNATAKLNDSDIVTVADKLSEAAIIGYVHEHYPEHSILSEESGSERRESEYEWVIDPVDGTTNYNAGLPMHCVSIGIRHRGVTVVGVVLAPYLNELFHAVRGEGAYLNGNRITVTANTDIHNATASVYGINGQQRDMTLILARDNSPEAIKEALLAHRTLAYAYGSIAGDEQLVRDFFNACVTHKVVSTNKKGVRTVRLTNNTSMTFLFSRGGNPFQLRPFTSRNMTVDEGKALKFTVENLWIPGDKPHPTIKIEVE